MELSIEIKKSNWGWIPPGNDGVTVIENGRIKLHRDLKAKMGSAFKSAVRVCHSYWMVCGWRLTSGCKPRPLYFCKTVPSNHHAPGVCGEEKMHEVGISKGQAFRIIGFQFPSGHISFAKNANSELFFWKFTWSEVGPWNLHVCKLLRWFLNSAIVSYYLTLLVVAYF